MPFPMKIQPIDSPTYRESIRTDNSKPVLKSRLKRLFDRQFPSVLKISAIEKPAVEAQQQQCGEKDAEFEPSSVCLAKMVQNFIEESHERQPAAAKCGRNRCNCFNGNNNDSSDDEFDLAAGLGDSVSSASVGDSSDTLKSLVPCSTTAERNLLADTSKIVEKNNKTCKTKDDMRKVVTDGLLILGYDASICKSRWEKCSSFPAGEYEYIDVMVEGERVLIDLDFRSEFEIARSTGSYRAMLQSLPYIFVGKADRLQQIVAVVTEAARQSLKKKGMHIPPWRKVEYMRGKWLSPHTRTTPPPDDAVDEPEGENMGCSAASECDCGEFELIFGEKTSSPETDCGGAGLFSSWSSPVVDSSGGVERSPAGLTAWVPPAVKPKSCERGKKAVVTGLASLFKEKP
ncbi:hypothetical protein RJ639_044194 [Escallonia herrerae]|uniref:Uncharacterized protein n=1 Tax=Escallonia herrerae TaxID=1293975 RepID=A0AA89B406_9ASTE|nr:hypothetical protein RJ639_044194 [Escallonia herrerae]